MKLNLLTTILCGAVLLSSCSKSTPETAVTWEMLQNNNGNYSHRITVTGDMDFDKLAFNVLPSNISTANPEDTIVEIVPGYYAVTSPRFQQGADSVVIDLITEGRFTNIAFAPDSFHKIMGDTATQAVNYTILPITRPEQWSTAEVDRMPYGEGIYDFNEAIAATQEPGVYDIIPSYKSVTMLDGTSKAPLAKTWVETKFSNPEAYQIIVRNDSMIVKAQSQVVANAATYAFEKQVLGDRAEIPNAIIDDYPDMPYRAIMIDISRNYQNPEMMKKVIDYLAQYRLNKLHFHFIDDEGWRLEIPSLPELTQVGARRGYTTDDSEFIAQVYSGDGNPDSPVYPANGYFTRQDFIDLLKYAQNLGIEVIPEVESPGHARAAVKAMEKRYRDTGDDSYRLIHDGDTSKYRSAQAYYDNVMNPALPATYKFMDTVISDIKAMYDEAGVPLNTIHIGGDEVAHGAWAGSEIAQNFMKENNLKTQTELHGYFTERVANILKEKGIKMSGWQEIAVDYTPAFDKRIIPQTYSVNCWSTLGNNTNVTSESAKKGYPTVLSNVNHFYLDLAYSRHPMENGLLWGGTVDEFVSLHGYPAKLCPVDKKSMKNVIGISGQLFSETLRSPEQLELYLFPKMLGLAERAWNNDSTYTDAQFNAIIGTSEIPGWEKDGRNFHLRQAGIKKANGQILMNSPYPGAEIRYTTDGTEPTAASAIYTEPLKDEGQKDVRARLYYHGKESPTTYMQKP